MSEVEFIGYMVAALASLLGLFSVFFKMILKPLTEIARDVNNAVQDIKENKEAIQEHKQNAKESHRRIWNQITEQDETLNDHERRIGILEHDKIRKRGDE